MVVEFEGKKTIVGISSSYWEKYYRTPVLNEVDFETKKKKKIE